jgi:hypothetical protein
MKSMRIKMEAKFALDRSMSPNLAPLVRDLAPTELECEMRMPHEFCLRDSSEEGEA